MPAVQWNDDFMALMEEANHVTLRTQQGTTQTGGCAGSGEGGPQSTWTCGLRGWVMLYRRYGELREVGTSSIKLQGSYGMLHPGWGGRNFGTVLIWCSPQPDNLSSILL